jgi:hypothetical protein
VGSSPVFHERGDFVGFWLGSERRPNEKRENESISRIDMQQKRKKESGGSSNGQWRYKGNGKRKDIREK